MQGNELRITVGQKKIVIFEPAEVKTLLGAAPGGLRLHMLLMLNCGMTQQDIADLKSDEVDSTLGRVTRKRSKTKKYADVPEVTCTLCPALPRPLAPHDCRQSLSAAVGGAI